jgi:hypothetical protein
MTGTCKERYQGQRDAGLDEGQEKSREGHLPNARKQEVDLLSL